VTGCVVEVKCETDVLPVQICLRYARVQGCWGDAWYCMGRDLPE
jgi:hypothetical protein